MQEILGIAGLGGLRRPMELADALVRTAEHGESCTEGVGGMAFDGLVPSNFGHLDRLGTEADSLLMPFHNR